MTETERKTRAGQRHLAFAMGWLAIVVLAVTVFFPVLGALGIGATVASVDGTCQIIERLDSPWGALAGTGMGVALGAISAAFAQVAVGETGLGLLRKLNPFGGGGKG